MHYASTIPGCFPETLDFIAGFTAINGTLTYAFDDIENDSCTGRAKCAGYTIAHIICIPLSAVVALVRMVIAPIFYLISACTQETDQNKCLIATVLFGYFLLEVSCVVTSPLWHMFGVAHAALGVINPSWYLKCPMHSNLTENQRAEAALAFHANLSNSSTSRVYHM